MHRLFRFGSLCFFILLATARVGGSEIYNNGPPDQAYGLEMTHWIEADDFTLGEASRLENVKFWDFEIPSDFEGTVLWQIYSNSDSNSPGTLLVSGTSPSRSHASTGFFLFGPFEEFMTDFNINPVCLPAGTYWLALHNGPLSNNVSQNVFWEATDNLGARPSYGQTAPFNGTWFSNAFPGFPSELAFKLGGTVLPRITEIGFDGGSPRISFTTVLGHNYRVDYTSNLSAGPWLPLPGAQVVGGTGNIVGVNDSELNVRRLSRRFYRVTLL